VNAALDSVLRRHPHPNPPHKGEGNRSCYVPSLLRDLFTVIPGPRSGARNP
jgi:hypothetical protein